MPDRNYQVFLGVSEASLASSLPLIVMLVTFWLSNTALHLDMAPTSFRCYFSMQVPKLQINLDPQERMILRLRVGTFQ